MFDSVNKPLNAVSEPVEDLIERSRSGLIDPARDGDPHMMISEVSSNLMATVSLVSRQSFRSEPGATSALPFDSSGFHKLIESRGLMSLTGSEYEGDEPSTAIGSDVNLGGEPSLAVAQSLFLCCAFWGSGCMLVGSNNGAVHKVDLPVHFSGYIRLGLQPRENTVPYPSVPSAEEPAVDRAPRTVVLGDVPPGSTRFELPKDCIDHSSVVFVGPSSLRFLSRKE